jgi:lipid-A-disaccharide synthase
MTAADRQLVAKPLTCFLVAAEHSGDHLGATLMRALRRRYGDRIRFDGVGGAEMGAEGLTSLFPIGELAIIGFMSIPARLPMFLRHLRETVDAVLAARPDVLVIIDSPDFTHLVARRVRKRDPSIPIVDYVCPSVWAWRPWRARKMRRYIDHVLAILPFEPEVLARLDGPPSSYVGHPLSERTEALRPTPQDLMRRDDTPPTVLVLPGSRHGELRRLLPVFGDALARVAARGGPFDLVLPTKAHLAAEIAAEVAGWTVKPRIVVDPAEKDEAFRTARAALAKSGTVTLELALAGVPMVTAYKVSAIEAFVARRVIQVSSVILANLVLGEKVVPEFLQEDCTAEKLADALLPLVQDGPERRLQVDAFARLDAILEIGTAVPSTRAADVVGGIVEQHAMLPR